MNTVHEVVTEYDSPEYRAAQMQPHMACIEITDSGAVFTDWGNKETWKEYKKTVKRLQEADKERAIYGIRQEI